MIACSHALAQEIARGESLVFHTSVQSRCVNGAWAFRTAGGRWVSLRVRRAGYSARTTWYEDASGVVRMPGVTLIIEPAKRYPLANVVD